MVVAMGTKSTVLTLVEEFPRAGTLRLRHPTEGAPMKALVIVDMLDDFVTGALANPHAERIVEPLARLLEHARAG